MVRVQTPSEENDALVGETLRELRAEQAARERRNAPRQPALRPRFVATKRTAESWCVSPTSDALRSKPMQRVSRRSTVDSQHLSTRAGRIFGRVLTRETVLQLRADHDAMERAFATLRAADAVDKEAAVAALVDSETAFELRLTENARELRRGEGPEWLEEITAELERSRSLRFALVDGARKLEDAALAFTQARAVLKSIAEPADVAAPAAERRLSRDTIVETVCRAPGERCFVRR